MGKTKQTKNGVVTSVLFGLGGGSGSGRGVDWEQGHAQVQEQPQLWISPLRRRRGPSDSSGGPQREDVNGGRQRPIVRCDIHSLLCRHAGAKPAAFVSHSCAAGSQPNGEVLVGSVSQERPH